MTYHFKALPELFWFLIVTVGTTMAANGFDPTSFTDPTALKVGFIAALLRALPAGLIALWGKIRAS